MGRKGRDYDVIVVGAGHNALVSAAYLAQAGYHVGVFERRHIVGGAVATEEIVPGYRFDIGGSAHILIRLTPVVEELGLERYGLEYLEIDPLFFAPFPDGDSVFIHRSEERTIQGLETKFPSQGEAYRRFLEDWRPFARMVRDAFLTVPGPLQLGRKVIFSKGMEMAWKEALPRILRPYGDVLDEYFTEEKIRTPLVWMGAQSGPPPTEPLSAPFVLWHPLYHEGGIARPRGGSGMLTVALAAHVRDHGGEVHVDAPVRRILVEGERVVGVEVDGRTYTARAVLSGAHAMETFGRLLPEEHVPDGARRMRAGNGFGAVLRLALDGPVRYTAHPGDEARVALQLLCRDRKQISAAYGDFLRGEPARDPPLVAMSFSAVDDTLAPPGHEVLWLWAQYFPYELADHVRPSGGEAGARGSGRAAGAAGSSESVGSSGSSGSASGWDVVGEEVADTILEAFEAYAPGTRDRVVGRLFQHPLLLERELGLCRGNVMHLEMSLDQMFGMRPFLGMSGYRGHLKGLYLTGASTHPGGGIMGASGRNAARVLLRDLERRRT